jgi:hypothetical protein
VDTDEDLFDTLLREIRLIATQRFQFQLSEVQREIGVVSRKGSEMARQLEKDLETNRLTDAGELNYALALT